VAHSFGLAVSVIDTTINAVVTTPVDLSPEGVAATPDGGYVHVTNFHTQRVSRIDTTTKGVLAKFVGEDQYPRGVAVASDGRYLYVTNSESNTVSVINSTTNAVITTISGGSRPAGVAVTAHDVYVANEGSNTVSAIIDDHPTQHLVDRSAEFGTSPALGAPTACVIPGLGVHNIAYRDTSGRLHELWRDAQGVTGTTNLAANADAPKAAGNPFAYVDTSRNTEILLYRSGDGTVRTLYWSTGPVGHDNLSGTAGAPKAAGYPVGYYAAAADSHHVIYRTGDGHLHELNWTGVAPVVYGGNLTGAISAPRAAGDPTAFVNAAGVNIVVFLACSFPLRDKRSDSGVSSSYNKPAEKSLKLADGGYRLYLEVRRTGVKL
jgi:YVTN family beta-propeller protein